MAYAPYGEEYNGSGTQDLAFTDQNQDTVKNGWSTNLYDFMFREYRTAHGRWSSPDPAGLGAVSTENPQSWNRYAYVLNDPAGLVDPLGLKWVCHQVWGTGAWIDTGSGTPVYTGSQALQICYYVPDVPDSVIVNGSNGGGNGQTTSGGGSGGGGAANNCQPPFICTPTPTVRRPPRVGPQPLSFWDKAGLVIACIAGMDPEFAKPIGEAPQPADSTDSTNTTEGQGPPFGLNKSGRSVPYGGSPEVPGGAANGAAYGAGIGQCITNVFTAWPK